MTSLLIEVKSRLGLTTFFIHRVGDNIEGYPERCLSMNPRFRLVPIIQGSKET